MKELLDSTGISSGSMYHSFPGGKEQLAATAVREVGLDAAERIRAVLEQSTSAADGIERIFAALARDHEASGFRFGCPVGVPATEASAASEQIREASREAFRAWEDAYRDALVAEGWADEPAAATASAIVTAYEGSVTMARALHSVDPIIAATAAISDLLRIRRG